jgi:hypothetical protein
MIRDSFWKLAILGLASTVVLLAQAPSAVASNHRQREFSDEFSLQGTNGYLVTVSGSRRTVDIEISKGRPRPNHFELATYTVDGLAWRRGINANFGDLGEISLSFEPSGKTETFAVPKSLEKCSGPRKIVRKLGTFEGVMRFAGENGYTVAETAEVKGSVGTPASFICATFGNGHPTKRHHHQTSAYLGATTHDDRLGFSAYRGEGRHRVDFSATVIEKNGLVAIRRYILSSAPRSSFVFDDSLSTATVAPPPPFSGTATFQRGPKGTSPSWSGSLAVSFPGAANIPLTRPGFFARLIRG